MGSTVGVTTISIRSLSAETTDESTYPLRLILVLLFFTTQESQIDRKTLDFQIFTVLNRHNAMYLFHIVMRLKWEHTIWSIIHINNSIKP